MAYDVITIAPTVSDAAHAAGDVMFNLTAVPLPPYIGGASYKLINLFMEVASGGGEDDTKIGVLFFRKNTTTSLGTLNATADISAANFTANEYLGSAFLGLTDGADNDLDLIDNVGIYYGSDVPNNAAGTRGGANPTPLILDAEIGDKPTYGAAVPTVYVAAVVHTGAPDLDGTDNVKVHLHIEY